MLCKNCEKVIPENQTVCSYCGTSAMDVLTENSNSRKNNNQYSNRKRNRKKNKRNNITRINDAVNIEPPPSAAESPDKMPQEFKPEIEAPQNVPEMPQESVPPEKPEIPNPPTEQPKDIQTDTLSEIERVSKNSELPKPDNKHTLPDSSGIVYEVAEKLYVKEKTASEIEALCQPPFKKVFSEKQIRQLDEQAKEKARTLVSSTVTEPEPEIKTKIENISVQEENNKLQNKPVTTAGAFLLQLVLLIPIVNIAAAMFFSFGKNANFNIKSYTRAFLMWCVIAMTAALIFFSVMYFSDPTHRITEINLNNLF